MLSSSVERMLNPVVLPPGCASEATSPESHHVVGNANNRNRSRDLLGGTNGLIATTKEGVDAGIDDLRRYFLVLPGLTGETASVDGKISPLEETLSTQTVEQRCELRGRTGQLVQKAKAINPSCLLR